MQIRTLADLAEIEKVSVWDRIPEQTVYERLRKVAHSQADHPAVHALLSGELTDTPHEISYGEFFRKTTQAANLFVSLGVGPEDVVSLLLPLIPEALYCLFGAMAVGMANPLNPLLEPAFLVGILRETASSVLVVSGQAMSAELWSRLAAMRAELPALRVVIRVDGIGRPPPGVIDFCEALAGQPGERLVAERPIRRETVAALFHTGGTTGSPKLARLTHGGLLVTAWGVAAAMSNGPETVSFLGLPLFHAAGAMILGLTPLCCGHTIVLLTPMGLRNPVIVRNHWAWAERLRATMIAAVPTTLSALLNMPEDGFDRTRVQFCCSGAAAVPVELANRFFERFKVPVVEGYGLTELHGCATLNPRAGQCRIGSVGLRMPYLELMVAEVSPDGSIRRHCDTDEVGQVLMRGPQVFAGYLHQENNHGVLLAEGWFLSGDLGRLDGDGYLWLTGRSKDVIIRGGHNIDPQLIEQALKGHPAVEMAAAVGRPDRYAGELPVAFVQPRSSCSASADELMAYCRQHIGERAAVPAEVIVVPTLPLTSIGKIHKPTLRKEAARRVLAAEVAKLAEANVMAHVEIVEHPRYGLLARIVVADSGGLDAAAITSRCRALIGDYQFRHEVEISATTLERAALGPAVSPR